MSSAATNSSTAPAQAETPTDAEAKILRSALGRLWGPSTPTFASSSTTSEGIGLATHIAPLEKAVEQLKQQTQALQVRLDRAERHEDLTDEMEQLQATVRRLDDVLGAQKHDTTYIQEQLERLANTLDNEKGQIAEHSEQLRYLAVNARQSHQGHGGRHGGGGSGLFAIVSQSVARALTPWLLSTLQGMFRVTRPVVGTLQSLWFLRKKGQSGDDGTEGGDGTGSGGQLWGNNGPSPRRGRRTRDGGFRDAQFAVGTASPAGLLRSARGAASLLLAVQRSAQQQQHPTDDKSSRTTVGVPSSSSSSPNAAARKAVSPPADPALVATGSNANNTAATKKKRNSWFEGMRQKDDGAKKKTPSTPT